jgi:hypothetical protein
MSTATAYSTGWILQHLPISTRQIHYWRSAGAITPSITGDRCPGSGNPVRWSQRDVSRLRVIAQFIETFEPLVGKVSVDAVRMIWRGLEHADEYDLRWWRPGVDRGAPA